MLIYRSWWNSVASFSRKLQSLHNIQHLCRFTLCNNGPFKSPEHHCLDEEHTAHSHSALIQEILKRSLSDIISMKSSKMMSHVLWKCKEKIIPAVHFSWSDTEVIKNLKMLWRKSTSEVLMSLYFELLRCCLECKLSDCQCLHFKDPHWSLVMNKEIIQMQTCLWRTLGQMFHSEVLNQHSLSLSLFPLDCELSYLLNMLYTFEKEFEIKTTNHYKPTLLVVSKI